MIPKKPNAVYKEVAEELNLPANLIEDFIEFYYKEIKIQKSFHYLSKF